MRSPLALLGVALFVGPGGQPLAVTAHGGASLRPGYVDEARHADGGEARRFLEAARGVAPLICSLAGTPVGDGWGYDAPPASVDPPDAATLSWALEPTLDEADLALLAGGLRDPDACVRAMAARLLASGGEDAAGALTVALEDGAPAVRRAAAEGLGYAKHRASAAALMRRVADADPGVRATAAWALGRIEAREAAATLGRALADPEPAVRLAAIGALGELDVDSAIDLLLPELRAEDARIRAAAAYALGQLH